MNKQKKKYGYLSMPIKVFILAFFAGLLFPIISGAILLFVNNIYPSLSSIWIIHKLNPLMWVIDSAPIVLGLIGYYLGKRVNEETKRMQQIIREQRDNFAHLAVFAEKIGKGNLEAKLEKVNKKDTLGRALIGMSQNLKENRTKTHDENWAAIGRDKIAAILREHRDLSLISEKILVEIIEYLGIVQGAFFITEGEGKTFKERKRKVTLNLTAHFAYGRKKYTKSQYKLGQGLIGEAAIEQHSIHRTEIPNDHLTITSGLITDEKPSALLIVPFVTEENLQGAIELAAFKRFTPVQINLVEELGEIIARTLLNLKLNNKTEHLLEESQKMTEELTENQDQLQKAALEMQQKQEEIEQANERQHTLLENASEIITIYNTDGIIQYISPSVKNILGYETEDLDGKAYNAFIAEEYANTFKEMLRAVEKDEQLIKTIHTEYSTKTGQKTWIESSARNKISDPSIKGIVVNSTDITERRKAEREQEMRGKMQALSENSKDIIMRFDLEGIFQYVNPMLEKYTGANSNDLMNTKFTEFAFNDTIKKAWQEIIDDVIKEEKLIVREMDFPIMNKNTIMLVNAIPEFDANNKLETILVVSSDITDRKEQEVVLEETNKKITDSINYAKRIQTAIIPPMQEIEETFPTSFMMYRPKDVVSGDFPYYYRKGDFVYYAAVDCTGHGVPGAMMSIIGHLILNDILSREGNLNAGEVLNLMHKGVVRTLKQDAEGNKAADGMDVGLCKINTKTLSLEYAGAHRPLYYCKEGDNEVLQIKGARYPVGGNQYAGKNNFENHVVNIAKGDSIYYFSDGYPDQFGGPEKLKFGPKRIRNIISESQNIPMPDQLTVFENAYDQWLGKGKQIDDVLLIGIKF